jgi:ankyrin repeat protein
MHHALMQKVSVYQVESLLALLNAYPDAAKIPDWQGQYPLHTALECNTKYYIGGGDFHVAPSLARVRQTNLFFFDRLLQIFPEAANLPIFLNPPILHRVLDWSLRRSKVKPIINEEACIKLILRANPSTASAVNPKNGRLPLHTALAHGTVPNAIVRRLLDAHPDAVKSRDFDKHLPLHLALAHQADLSLIDRLLQIFPDATKLPDGMNRPILHMAVDRRTLRSIMPNQTTTRVDWRPKYIMKEKGCIELILYEVPI